MCSARFPTAADEPADGRDLTTVLTNLARLARVSVATSTMDEFVELAAEEVRLGLGAASASVTQLLPGTGVLRTLVNVGDLGPTEDRWPQNEVYSLQTFLQLRGTASELQTWTVSLNDPEANPVELALLKSLGKGSSMTMPLIVNDTLWGELYVTYRNADRTFGPEHRAYAEVYRVTLESGLMNAMQIHTLQRLAFQDPMTGLANRRALDEAAETAFDRLAAKTMLRINVVAIDLNGLKLVNDRNGHTEGDRLITLAAGIIQTHFNSLPGSLAARVGGDEFVVLVPSHSTDLVAAAAQSACTEIAELALGDGASCGVAVADCADTDTSMQQLFRRADAMQYQSKRSGGVVAVDDPRRARTMNSHRSESAGADAGVELAAG